MALWEDIELLCHAIREEGEKERQALIRRAKMEAERLIKETQERVHRELEEKLAAKKAEIQAEARRIVDAAEYEARQKIISFQERVYQEILKAVEERLQELPQRPDYGDFLLKILNEALKGLAEKEIIVELSSRDKEKWAEKIREEAQRQGVEVEVVSAEIQGGLRAYSKDKRRIFDQSLEARLKRLEPKFRQIVAQRLFHV